MDIVIIIAGHLLTFIGALTAVLGDTFHSDKSGFNKLTKVGWSAAIVATLGISLSIFQSVDDHITKQVYEDIALKDIRKGWRQVASPFTLLLWEVTDEKTNISLQTIKDLNNQETLSKISAIDFTKKTKIPQYSTMNLGQIACKQSSLGMKIMQSSVQKNTVSISREIALKVESLRQSGTFGGLLAAGCGSTLDRTPNFKEFIELFKRSDMPVYLNDLIELGELLGDPGIKR